MEEAREAVEDKVIELYSNKAEDLSRILYYLDRDAKSTGDESSISPILRVLFKLVANNETFKSYVDRLIRDTKTAEENPKFFAFIQGFHRQMLDPGENPLDESGECQQGLRDLTLSTHGASAMVGFAHAWGRIPVATQVQIINLARNTHGQLAAFVEGTSGMVAKYGSKAVVVTLAVAQLTWEALRSINAWWEGRISGERCAKNIIDATAALAAGIGGGYGGAVAGTAIFPGVGTVVGAIVGSVAASVVTEAVVGYATQKIFDVPKEVALENAYRFFGLKHHASNSEINRAYRELCLEHHPDRQGGSHDKFLEVQVNLQIVKMARGQHYS